MLHPLRLLLCFPRASVNCCCRHLLWRRLCGNGAERPCVAVAVLACAALAVAMEPSRVASAGAAAALVACLTALWTRKLVVPDWGECALRSRKPRVCGCRVRLT